MVLQTAVVHDGFHLQLPGLLVLKPSGMVKLASASLQIWTWFYTIPLTQTEGSQVKGITHDPEIMNVTLPRLGPVIVLDGSKLFLMISLSSSPILINCILYHK